MIFLYVAGLTFIFGLYGFDPFAFRSLGRGGHRQSGHEGRAQMPSVH